MKTFQRFIESKLINEVDAPPPPTGGGPAASAPMASTPPGGDPLGGSPLGASMGMPPPPPLGGGMSPLGGPMGAPPGAPTGQTAPTKLKASNVWDVLERLLGSDDPQKNLKNG
jgi:hypothetical protein